MALLAPPPPMKFSFSQFACGVSYGVNANAGAFLQTAPVLMGWLCYFGFLAEWGAEFAKAGSWGSWKLGFKEDLELRSLSQQ